MWNDYFWMCCLITFVNMLITQILYSCMLSNTLFLVLLKLFVTCFHNDIILILSVIYNHLHIYFNSYCSFIETAPRPVDEEDGEEFLFDISDEDIWVLLHTFIECCRLYTFSCCMLELPLEIVKRFEMRQILMGRLWK